MLAVPDGEVGVLLRARDRVARGWMQRAMHERLGGHDYYCAYGALQADTAHGWDRLRAVQDLARASGRRWWSMTPSNWWVMKYNDSHRHEDVLAMFDAAIEIASARVKVKA